MKNLFFKIFNAVFCEGCNLSRSFVYKSIGCSLNVITALGPMSDSSLFYC
jgi:hypothetical protein